MVTNPEDQDRFFVDRKQKSGLSDHYKLIMLTVYTVSAFQFDVSLS